MADIKEILENAQHEIAEADEKAIDAVRVKYLGKKGPLAALMKEMGRLSAEERPAFGAMVNSARQSIESALEEAKKKIGERMLAAKLRDETVDITAPGKVPVKGHIHPIEDARRRFEEIFLGLGFSIAEGPEIEYDKYNFEMLNIPKNHPARDMHDTFYFTDNILLRTHTSPVQARVMLSQKPPIKIICPGRVYRFDEVDASHSPVFHQCEGLVIDKGISMSHLNGVLDLYAKKMYGEDTRVRFRPSYFPFTEPSAEMDISCTVCGGKGCRVCKGTGWIELLGCGMVNPKVLEACGIDTEVYSGFAFGMGIDRAAMMSRGITDLRLLFENDVRLIRQF